MKPKYNYYYFFNILLFCILSLFLVSCSFKPSEKVVPIIFDTDIGPDYDDVGAITILHAMEENGETKILATIASNKYEGIAAVLDVFNTYWGNPDIPIGVPKGKGIVNPDSRHWTDSILTKYPHSIHSNSEVPGAVDVYRKILSTQPDSSVTIVTVGFLTNLAKLLHSKGDKYSPLDGRKLVRKKVKLLVSMAGEFPSGKEHNLKTDLNSSKEVFDNWPTPIIFSGFEIGVNIKTGLPLVQNENIQNNPAKDVYGICIPMTPADSAGRTSYDQTAVFVAVRGAKPYFTLHEGRIIINQDGSNSWNNDGKGQYYLIQRESPDRIMKVIDHLMMQIPARDKR